MAKYICNKKKVWHKFDVEKFLHEVSAEYEQLAQSDSHFAHITRDVESLRKMWDETMAMPACGDPTIYPNRGHQIEPALMKVWHKAGGFWRANGCSCNLSLWCDDADEPRRAEFEYTDEVFDNATAEPMTAERNDCYNSSVELERLRVENERLMAQLAAQGGYEGDIIASQGRKDCNGESVTMEPVSAVKVYDNGKNGKYGNYGKSEGYSAREYYGLNGGSTVSDCSTVKMSIAADDDRERTKKMLKEAGAWALGVSLTMAVLWETGLLIPVGLVGLVMGGAYKIK